MQEKNRSKDVYNFIETKPRTGVYVTVVTVFVTITALVFTLESPNVDVGMRGA